MAKREMIKAKQEKAFMFALPSFSVQRLRSDGFDMSRRVQKFRSDYMELKSQFDGAKRQATDSVCGEILT